MDASEVSRIRNSPKFLELERKRDRFSWTLCVIMLVIYYGFILVVAFDKTLITRQIAGVITLAFPIGVGIIVSAIVLTGIYVLRANSEFDRLTREIVGGVRADAAVPNGKSMGAAR